MSRAGTPASRSAVGVADAVVTDRVEVGGLDERGRQPVEPAEERGQQRVAQVVARRHVVVAIGVHRALGEDGGVRVLAHRGGGLGHVGRRVQERLVPQPVVSVVAQHLGHHGREGAAGGVAADRHPGGVRPQHVTADPDPGRGVDAVLDGHRGAVLGRHPVVDRHHDAAHLGRDERADRVGVEHVAEHPATAVEPHDDRHVTLRVAQRARAVEAQGDLVLVAGRGGAVGDAHGGVDAARDAVDQRVAGERVRPCPLDAVEVERLDRTLEPVADQ